MSRPLDPVDHFAALGVSRDASSSEIRKAFKRLARRFHPDAGHGFGVERFHEVQAAWAVLRDPDRRRAHRATLDAWDPPGSPRPPPRPPPHAPPPAPEPAAPQAPEPERPPAEARVAILASLAQRGGRVLTRIPLRQRCPACADAPIARRLCRACSGAGVLTLRVKAFVTVPAGVTDGERREVPVELELYGASVRPVTFEVLGGAP